MLDALNVISASHPSNRLFASVIKKAAVSPDDLVDLAFEQLASCFEHYLKRLLSRGDTQRGIIVSDKSGYETSIQTLAAEFHTIGYLWGIIRNFAEVPLFLDSNASWLIQPADLFAFAVLRRFESGDSQYFGVIKFRFDTEGSIIHGSYIAEARPGQ